MRTRTRMRTNKNKNKTLKCKQFCKKIFLPEKERAEIKYAKKKGIEYIPLAKEEKEMAKVLKNWYLASCDGIYCQKKCNPEKKQWAKTISQKRKQRLISKGALSGCIDVIKEYPGYNGDIV